MYIYICLLLFLIAFGITLFSNKTNNEDNVIVKRKVYLVISFSVLFFMMAARSIEVGTDTRLYVSVFKNYCNMSWTDILSFKDAFIGFAIFNKSVSVISDNPHAILWASSALICFLTARFIYQNSRHVVYSTLLFIIFYHYLNCFNIFRQYIAIMIVVNALPFLIKKDFKKYFFICLLAMSIHNTAIMALFLLPLSIIDFNKLSISLYTFFMFFIILFVPLIMNAFANVFPHYQMYFENQYMAYSGLGLTIFVITYSLISILALMVNFDSDVEKRKFLLLLMINNLSIIANIMSYKYFILYRVSLYYSVYLIVFIPMVFEKYKKNVVLYFMLFMVISMTFVNKLINNDSQVVPYRTDIFRVNN